MQVIRKTIVLLLVSFIFSLPFFGQERYWVNGSGDWNNPQHWSEVSGGKGGASVPDLNCDVFIDRNSTAKGGLIIEVNSAIFANSITSTLKSKKLDFRISNDAWLLTNTTPAQSFAEKFDRPITNVKNTQNIVTKTSFTIDVAVDQNVSCNGASDGAFTITVTSGGTQPFTYYWTKLPVGPSGSNATSNTVQSFNGLLAGSYAIYVEDNDGHTAEAAIQITQPAALSMAAGNLTITDVSCAGQTNGKIEASASGGTEPYTYSITPAVQANNADGIFDNLASDTYTITVNDANNCGPVSVAGVFVDEPGAINISSVNVTQPTCFGESDGILVITANGGYNLEYSINGPGGPFQGSNTFAVSAGTYTIVVRDQTFTSCSATYGSNPVTVGEPDEVIISTLISSEISCFGADDGIVQISVVSGGVAPFNVLLDGNPWGALPGDGLIGGLTPGNHEFIVEDANGCQSQLSSKTLTEPDQLSIASTVIAHPTCFGALDGQIQINVTNGGVGALELSVDGGAYQAFTDGDVITGLGDGPHTFTLRDANACTSAQITETLNQPVQVVISAAKNQDLGCYQAGDGSVNVSITSGGVAPFKVSVDGAVAIDLPADGNITGLDAGNHTFKVIDANGCESNTETVTLTEPGEIIIAAVVVQDLTCFASDDGQIQLNITSGGSAPFELSIDGGAFQPYNSGDVIPDLSGGEHTFVVQDNNGCQSATLSQSLVEPDPVVISSSVNQNLTCFNSGDGSVLLTITSGGVAPFQVIVDGAAPVPLPGDGLINSLDAGEHGFRVIDNNSCLSNETRISLSQPDEIVLSSTIINEPSCFASSDGEVQVNIESGGIAPPYEISVDGGAFQAFVSGDRIGGLNNGDHNFVVRDANGCLSTLHTETLTEPLQVQITATKQGDVSCFGSGNGEVKITVTSGGIAPFTLSIDGAAPVALPADGIIGNLDAGNHTFKVIDANLCESNTASVNIVEPAEIDVTTTIIQHLTCFQSGDGIIDVTVNSGGTAPFEVSLDQGNTYIYAPGVILNLAAGEYQVVVRDNNGCESIADAVTVTQPDELLFTLEQTDISCSGANDGSIRVDAVGGTRPYEYSRNNGASYQADSLFSNLIKGSFYYVKVRDANGCSYPSGTGVNVTIEEPEQIVVDSLNQNNVTCHSGNDGKIVLYVSGGMEPIEFSADNGVTWQASNVFNNLVAGNYTILIKDANDCQISKTFEITQPSEITVFSLLTEDLECNGIPIGSIEVIATGGTGQLTYSIDGIAYQTGTLFENLDAGDYDVYAKDINGCIKLLATVTINEPPAIEVDALTTIDLSCNGSADGEITLTASGGIAPLQVSLNGGAFQVNGFNFANLAAGDHIIQIKDASDCTLDTTITLNEPDAIVIDNEEFTHISCHDANDGSITITASGGIAPLEYSIDGGASYNGSNVFNNLAAGGYQISVRDANLCEVLGSVMIINNPGEITLPPATITHLNCNNDGSGTMTINVSGGTAPYEYSIDNGLTFQTEATFSGLNSGSYAIVVRDVNGCSASGSETITEPEKLRRWKPEESTNISTCYGDNIGSIFIHVAGGTQPYQFSINGTDGPFQSDSLFTLLPAGNYSVYVQDANGCEVIGNSIIITQPSEIQVDYTVVQISGPGATDGEITINASGGTPGLNPRYEYSIDKGITWDTDNHFIGLGEGWYYLAVRDGNSCVMHGDSIFLSPLSIVSEITHISCNGANDGQISVAVSDGNSPYALTWSGPDGFSKNIVVADDPARDTIRNLVPGAYELEVVDNNGNTKVTTFTVNEPDLIQVVFSETLPTCFGESDGALDITVSGGTAPYDFSWNTADLTEDINGLASGTYTVEVTDANSCIFQASYDLSEPDALSVSISLASPLSADDQTDGEILVVGIGGTPAYDITLYRVGDAFTDGPRNTALNYTFTNLAEGEYYAEITDANGCGIVRSDTVYMTSLDVSLSLSPISCAGANDAKIVASIQGGMPDFIYEWSKDGIDMGIVTNTSELKDSIMNLGPGNYSVLVTDSYLNTASASILVVNPLPLSLVYDSTNLSCFESADGSINLSVSGGTGAYAFTWSGPNGFNSVLEDINGLEAGTYTVHITDANLCELDTTITIGQPEKLIVLDFIADFPYICASRLGENAVWNTGSASVNADGGTGDYSYLWESSGETSQLAQALVAQDVNDVWQVVQVMDENGCVAVDSVRLDPNPMIDIDIDQITDIKCFGDSTASLLINKVEGGTPYLTEPKYRYLWSTGDATVSISDLFAGTYSVVVTDMIGCSQEKSIQVNEPAEIIPFDFTISQANCAPFSSSDIGAVNVITTTGGTEPYNYQWLDEDLNELDGETNNTLANVNAGTYYLEITDKNNCIAVHDFEIDAKVNIDAEIKRLLNGSFTGLKKVCKDSLIYLSATTADPLITPMYEWYYHDQQLPSSSDFLSHEIDSSVTFLVKITEMGNDYGCFDIAEFKAELYPRMLLQLGPDVRKVVFKTGISLGDSITVVDSLVHKYQWYATGGGTFNAAEEGADTTKNPRVYVDQNTEFLLQAISIDGCGEMDSVLVKVITNIKPPIAFTPNEDGVNDEWWIMPLDNFNEFPELEVTIYNRWGGKVFESKGYKEPWRGKSNGGIPLPAGTYYYVINPNKENLVPVSGSVTIIR